MVESLSHSKDQQNQLTSLEKQQVTDQSNKVNNQYQNNQHQKHQKKPKAINIKITKQNNQHQNHWHNNNHERKHQTRYHIGQQIQKKDIETNQQEKQVCKNLLCG